MSLLFYTSPAKTLDLNMNWSAQEVEQPRHLNKTQKLASFLKKQSIKRLEKILEVSNKIAKMNRQYFKDWEKKHTKKNSKPAILMYKGDIYKQFEATNFSSKEQEYAQNYLRIISGLYGMLRPYDLIQAYRLEMKTNLEILNGTSLAKWWQKDLTEQINKDCKTLKIQTIINLASQEYSRAIDKKSLSYPLIHIDFKEMKDGEEKTVAIYSKQARGLMIKYVIENQVTKFEELKAFSVGGYKFKKQIKDRLVFVRES